MTQVADRSLKQHTGGETVIVVCKVPMGMLLDVHRKNVVQTLILGGGTRPEDVYTADSGKVFINGPATLKGNSPKCRVVGDYAFTPGVPKDFWERWMAEYKMWDAVKRKLIAAFKDMASAESFAHDHSEIRTGLEPLNPNALPKGIQAVPRTGDGAKFALDAVARIDA
jgi:hypothetical protein